MVILSDNWRIDLSAKPELYARSTTPAIEQEPTPIEDEIQARVRRIRRLSTGDRLYAQSQLASRIKVMERNIANGYREYIPALEVEKRVLELSQIGILDG
jgi:predicted nucleic acid-binding protein